MLHYHFHADDTVVCFVCNKNGTEEVFDSMRSTLQKPFNDFKLPLDTRKENLLNLTGQVDGLC